MTNLLACQDLERIMLDVSPLHRAYETLPNLNPQEIPALPRCRQGIESQDTARLSSALAMRILAAGHTIWPAGVSMSSRSNWLRCRTLPAMIRTMAYEA
jgi:hypothetical protein